MDKFLGSLIEQPNIRKIQRNIALFKYAIKQDQDTEQKESEKITKYFTSPQSYAKMIQFSLMEFLDILKDFFNVEENLKKSDLPNYATEIMVKSFLYNAYKFAEQTVNSQEDNEQLIIFTCKALGKLNSLMYPFENLLKKSANLLLQVWSTHPSLPVKIHAFVHLRSLFLHLSDFNQQMLLKKFFKSFQDAAKHVTWRNYESLTLMINCVTEVFGLNMDQSYLVMYTSLKSQVDLLKKCSDNKNDENVRKIYNQQTLFTLKLWVRMLSLYGKEDQVGELTHPLVQVIQGLIKFQPSVDYFPLQLHFTDMLIQIASKQKIRVPVLQELLYLLDCGDLKRKKPKTSLKPYEFEFGISIKQKQKLSGAFWSDFCRQVVERIITYIAVHSRDLTFPEEVVFPLKQLRVIQKSLGFDGNKMRVRKLVLMVGKQVDLILQLRTNVKSPISKIKEAQIEFKKLIKKVKENPIESEAQRIAFEREEMVKQKILAEKERIDQQDDLSSEQQEIEDDKDQEFVFDEIKKERDLEKQNKKNLQEYDGDIDFEGDPNID